MPDRCLKDAVTNISKVSSGYLSPTRDFCFADQLEKRRFFKGRGRGAGIRWDVTECLWQGPQGGPTLTGVHWEWTELTPAPTAFHAASAPKPKPPISTTFFSVLQVVRSLPVGAASVSVCGASAGFCVYAATGPAPTLLRRSTRGPWWPTHTRKRAHQVCLPPSARWSVWHWGRATEAWQSDTLQNHNLFLGCTTPESSPNSEVPHARS